MTREEYMNEVKFHKEAISATNKRLSNLRAEYIAKSAPCKIGDKVELITAGGRKIVGEAKSFAIFDGHIFVETIKPEGKPNVYLSVPHKGLTVVC